MTTGGEAVYPIVSIVIPVYNGEAYLEETLNSALNQTLQKFEIVIVDDSSTDATPFIIERYTELDPRIRYIRLESNSNLPAVPRNLGISKARGEFIAFLDSDDVWFPKKLERQISVLEANPSVSLVHSHLLGKRNSGSFIDLLKIRDPALLRATHPEILLGNVIMCSSVVVRRSVLNEVGGFDEDPKLRAVEDYELWIRISKGNSIAYLPEIHGRYRLYPESTSARENMQARLKHLSAIHGVKMPYRSQTGHYWSKTTHYPAAAFYHLLQGQLRQLFNLEPCIFI